MKTSFFDGQVFPLTNNSADFDKKLGDYVQDWVPPFSGNLNAEAPSVNFYRCIRVDGVNFTGTREECDKFFSEVA